MPLRADANRTNAPERRPVTLSDIEILRDAILECDAKFVTIDPFVAFLPADVNAHKDQDVRRVLARLKELAEETGAAIVLVRHLRKTEDGNAVYRGGGSIGIVGAARVGLLVARDPDDPKRRVLAVTKNNLAKEMPSLSFELADSLNGAARVHWLGTSKHSADELVAPHRSKEHSAALAEAELFLSDILCAGPIPANEAKTQAEEAGISKRTLDRATDSLGVSARRLGFGKGAQWVWAMPLQSTQSVVPGSTESY